MAHPCSAPVCSVRRMSRSSVPCKRSSRDFWAIGVERLHQYRRVVVGCQQQRGRFSRHAVGQRSFGHPPPLLWLGTSKKSREKESGTVSDRPVFLPLSLGWQKEPRQRHADSPCPFREIARMSFGYQC